ncbi:hypothetical protein RG47T_0995 [Mucilaginibacter polytrichastri]|uniref:Acyltransferase 3 domain-containing protein n=2 Tax=Mucilaginibacter polytrichastri TaxID=1302689 RepID=A0A1Q5ZUU1_9SPHI|nr:hypothetical protein RG47T_0995 [Mucilaginibacter polytrichastri]
MVDVGYGFMVLGAICPTCFLYRLSSKYTGIIATLSFAVYLSHKMVIHMVQLYLVKWIDSNSNVMFLACILVALFTAWIMNNLIEKPFLRLRNKILYQNN